MIIIHIFLHHPSISPRMSHGQGRYVGRPQYPQQQPYNQMEELNKGLKNMGMSPQGPPQQAPNNGMMLQNTFHATDSNRAAARAQQGVSSNEFLNSLGFSNQPTSPRPAAAGFGMQQPPAAHRSPGAGFGMVQAQPMPGQAPFGMMQAQPVPVQAPFGMVAVQAQPPPPVTRVPAAASSPSSSLSVGASEFIPGFRKPEKKIVLYTFENFKRRSKADDEMAINDVS